MELIKQDEDVDVQNGMNTKLWIDPWHPLGPLCHQAIAPVSIQDNLVPISHYWINGVGWNQTELGALLLVTALEGLKPLWISEALPNWDAKIWRYTSNDQYSVKLGCEVLRNPTHHPNQLWKLVWKVKVPRRICTFLQKVSHGKIMCNVEKKKRQVVVNDVCNLCNLQLDDILHVLRDCQHLGQLTFGVISSIFLMFNPDFFLI